MCVRKMDALVMPHMKRRAGAAGLQPQSRSNGFSSDSDSDYLCWTSHHISACPEYSMMKTVL